MISNAPVIEDHFTADSVQILCCLMDEDELMSSRNYLIELRLN